MESYEPELVDPFTEQWRWSTIDVPSDFNIRHMEQDLSGNIWFALNNGVARFDGQTWTHFDRESVGSSSNTFFIVPDGEKEVYAVTQDAVYYFDGTIWLKRNDHHIPLNFVYDITHPAFLAQDGSLWVTHFDGIDIIEGEDVQTIRNLGEIFSTIFQESSGAVWLVSLEGTVYRTKLENGDLPAKSKWRVMRVSDVKPAEGAAMLEAEDGRFWIIDSNHRSPVSVYNPEDGTWEDIQLDQFGGVNRVQGLLETDDGRIWISGYSNLHVYDGDNWEIYQSPDFRVTDGEPLLFQSKDGYLWLGEQLEFIQRIDIGNKLGTTFKSLQFQCEDEVGNRWYLEFDGRIVKENRRNGQWTAYNVDDGIIDAPVAILHASNDWLWVSGTHEGLAAINFFDGEQWHRRLHPEFASVMGHMALIETRSGDILFGADQHPDMQLPGTGGLLRYKAAKDGFHPEITTVPSMPYQIPKIEEGSDGSLWIGGVFLKKYDGTSTKRVHSDNNETSGWIDYILTGQDGSMWLAIWGSGALRLKDGKWDVFNEEHGLNTSLVSHLLMLEDGTICCVTDKGLYRFEDNNWFKFAIPYDFFLNRGYGTIKQSKDGSIWINQGNRAWYKRTLYATKQAQPDQTFLTSQYIPDKEAPGVHQIQRFQNPNDPGKITLFWKGTDQWARSPYEQLLYSFRLDGGAWSVFDGEASASFEGLSMGKHSFEIRVRDRDFNVGSIHEPIEFQIIFPMWMQKWFWGLIILLVLSVVTLLVILVRIRVRHIIELEEMKIDFFTNISHELRTPLSLILGPLESIKSVVAKDSKVSEKVKIAVDNANRLKDLVNQLLDFRKEDTIKREPRKEWGDILEFSVGILRRFHFLARKKNQQLVYLGKHGSCLCNFPMEALHKVLDNLLANAIKYTPRNGKITLGLNFEAEGDSVSNVSIVIQDTGPGISKEDQEHIFQPFVRARRTHADPIYGTGIGLALTKHLVERCGGRIQLESPVDPNNKGTKFTVSLPISGKTELKRTELEPYEVTADQEIETSGAGLRSAFKPLINPDLTNQDQEVVLVVENNHDLAHFIQTELSEHFTVMLAYDGVEGLSLARKHVPNIIITDYLMPEMDGFQLCRTIRNDRTTSHIPIVVITALNSEEVEEQGLAAGANEFIRKPFSITSLALRIRNQLEIRQRYARSLKRLISPENVPMESPEEVQEDSFVEKARKLAEENLSDVDFTVESLAVDMGMSRTQFYRKFRAMTDISPANFLRTMRLNRAARLLKVDNLSISEVAEQTGYSENSNFSRAFKDHFGYPPSEHR